MKRLLSVFLTLCMLISMTSAALASDFEGEYATAANNDENAAVSQSAETGDVNLAADDEKYHITVGYDSISSRNLKGKGWSYSPDDKTLTLSGYNGESVEFDSSAKGTYTIIIDGENSITANYGSGIRLGATGATLIIKNKTSLTADKLIVKSTSQNAIFAYNAYQSYRENIVIDGATIEAHGDEAGITASSSLTIRNSDIKAYGNRSYALQGGKYTSSATAILNIENSRIYAETTNGSIALCSAPIFADGENYLWRTGGSGEFVSGISTPFTNSGNPKIVEFAMGVTHNVTLEFNGGKQIGGNAVTKYAEGVGVALPTSVEKEGYTFGGWYENKDFGGSPVTAIDASATGDKTFYAKWIVNKYTITFDTDGGSAIDAITADYGTAITAPSDPTKTGYTFAGWDKEIPTTMPAENMTIKAKWTADKYTITFDTDGGSAIDAITADYGTAITAPSDPTKTGYTFAGWDKEIPTTMPAENMTIKAKWTVNKYTITFDTDGGSAIDAITADYGTAITAPTDPTKTGYTFAGWDKEIPTTMPAENMTIKAKWTQASVTPDPTPTTPSTSGSSRRKSGTSISLGSSTNIDGRFADVSSGDWFASGVKYVLDNNIMNGVSANTFEPNGNLTRGMFVTMLYRADGRTDVIKSVFDDVADSAYYANAVGWAAANGIVLGVSDTMYAPDDNITREQMAAIMYRYFEYKGRAGVAKRANMAAYADADSISEYAKNAVSWACAKNIISGKASGIIAPNDYATRAEAATILMRLANSVN